MLFSFERVLVGEKLLAPPVDIYSARAGNRPCVQARAAVGTTGTAVTGVAPGHRNVSANDATECAGLCSEPVNPPHDG